MPLGAAHRASVEDTMRSERSKGCSKNLYSIGFGGFDSISLTHDQRMTWTLTPTLSFLHALSAV